ncbi:DUF6456 domain-containing protein [Pseudooceanicola sp. C21-150M6]|uniref:DUF6456 domain-containing protein n=1 Tax=Pseudooceanicola sp. C21-150M6 TaxID=3434355 RepID=UPI003D7FC304
MDQDVQIYQQVMPTWVPDAVRRYIAHTEGGTSIRSLARLEGCHASTVMRQIRQVETLREDLLVDEAIGWLGNIFPKIVSEKKTVSRPDPGFRSDDTLPHSAPLEKETVPALRRLAQPGAVLAVAPNMDRAVIVRNGNGAETHRLGIVDRRVAQALALNGWISCELSGEPGGAGRLSRYRITDIGRQELKTMLARAENRASGFAEQPALFAAQRPAPPRPRQRSSLPETPVQSLARRREADGTPFLDQDLVRAAGRIQDDFELAQMEPRMTTRWSDYLTQGVTGGPAGSGEGQTTAAAARQRVTDALRVLGPGLGDVVLECCCRLHGLEAAERKLGWSSRSAKVVLRIALQRLKMHYDSLNDGGGLIG